MAVHSKCVNDTYCNAPCKGNTSEACGTDNYASVYNISTVQFISKRDEDNMFALPFRGADRRARPDGGLTFSEWLRGGRKLLQPPKEDPRFVEATLLPRHLQGIDGDGASHDENPPAPQPSKPRDDIRMPLKKRESKKREKGWTQQDWMKRWIWGHEDIRTKRRDGYDRRRHDNDDGRSRRRVDKFWAGVDVFRH